MSYPMHRKKVRKKGEQEEEQEPEQEEEQEPEQEEEQEPALALTEFDHNSLNPQQNGVGLAGTDVLAIHTPPPSMTHSLALNDVETDDVQSFVVDAPRSQSPTPAEFLSPAETRHMTNEEIMELVHPVDTRGGAALRKQWRQQCSWTVNDARCTKAAIYGYKGRCIDHFCDMVRNGAMRISRYGTRQPVANSLYHRPRQQGNDSSSSGDSTENAVYSKDRAANTASKSKRSTTSATSAFSQSDARPMASRASPVQSQARPPAAVRNRSETGNERKVNEQGARQHHRHTTCRFPLCSSKALPGDDLCKTCRDVLREQRHQQDQIRSTAAHRRQSPNPYDFEPDGAYAGLDPDDDWRSIQTRAMSRDYSPQVRCAQQQEYRDQARAGRGQRPASPPHGGGQRPASPPGRGYERQASASFYDDIYNDVRRAAGGRRCRNFLACTHWGNAANEGYCSDCYAQLHGK